MDKNDVKYKHTSLCSILEVYVLNKLLNSRILQKIPIVEKLPFFLKRDFYLN